MGIVDSAQDNGRDDERAPWWHDFDLGPLRDLPQAGHERVLLRLLGTYGPFKLLEHSNALVQKLIGDGWEVHAPLFHTEDVVVVPTAWDGAVVYNLNDTFYAEKRGVPVAEDPVGLIDAMVRSVTARDGVRRAVYLPLIDLYPDWFSEPFGGALHAAAERIVAKDSGAALVIASTMKRSAVPDWATFDTILVTEPDKIQVEK
ncbi:hypothetical protein BKG82_26925 [Mycobacteroides chelonae]|uniref:Uncharacterized protein n=1 Tax=Mycobacteroides chelonae TaxID=1774 RepID=A0A1S1LHV6_MYCCH|nr:hypothetical protein [Mycobacteroides chelonae]OHU47287.1 hypothetical protein BKG82_26925 [Mycobacteroides chelonae]